ncbi:MAG: DUF763 domain-containing protein [Bacteroidota bacterium]
MKNSGNADLPLHNGKVPHWLADRMARLGGEISEVIVQDYGRDAFLTKLSDPLWFQSLGCVLGMDWHSSGITTSVMGALKKALNPRSKELGIFICGGRGKYSLQTPQELTAVANKTGLNGRALVNSSKLSAKVDNTAVQDGYNIYLHSFIVTTEGKWAVVQQGMNANNGFARRYHWHSDSIKSFVQEPHKAVCGENKGPILNLTAAESAETKEVILEISKNNPDRIIKEVRHIKMPRRHSVNGMDVDLKRLGSVLALAHDSGVSTFEDLLLTKGLGPRTLQSLTLVSEIIYGTPSRFKDPARFSFAHGGKDGHPFPVPLKVYDETIAVLKNVVNKAKIDRSDKKKAFYNLHKQALNIEPNFKPDRSQFDKIIQSERRMSYKYGGMTVSGPALRHSGQLSLF